MFSKLSVLGMLLFLIPALLGGETWVKVAKNPEDGWRLLVNGEPMSPHGVVWSFTPIGQNYSFDLWSKPENYIKRMLDTDGALMRDMGVNVIRVFSDIPPRWITYFYENYGIYTVVNDLFGRYGMTVDGRWHARTNYADVRTRKVILEEMRENIQRYTNVPGVLFYLLGNENNYGLEWESEKIEDLPVGQRLETRAGYLYSLFEEGIQIIKEIDPTKPVGIVNGDIQYLNIIKTLVPSLDLLGVNTYRGEASYDLFYESIHETLDVPLIYTEFGSDAYNVAEEREDQYNQALFIRSQWKEIYQQSYGKGRYQNALGGFVFQWMDEWWKTGMTEGLDLHDTTGSWNNGAYHFDAVPGENNMNEEWFGIVSQSTRKTLGINQRVPRAAYYLLQELWGLDQLNSSNEEIEARFETDPRIYANQAKIARIQQDKKEQGVVNLRGKAVFAGNGYFTDEQAREGVFDNMSTSQGQWAYLGLDLMPLSNLRGGLTLRVQGEVPDTIFEREEYTRYGYFYISNSVLSDPANPANNPPVPDQEYKPTPPVDIYDGSLNWETPYMDFDFYYHNGHTDWGSEGDFFHLLPESFDFFGMDKEGSKAPYGGEFTGKQFLEGLKIYAGPEIFWDADPQIMTKYYRDNETLSWSLIYNEVFTVSKYLRENRYTRRVSGWVGLDTLPWIKADFGVLFSGIERLNKSYDHVEKEPDGTYTVVPDQKIDVLDLFSFKAALSSEIILHTRFFASYLYAGRVSNSQFYIPRTGTQIADIGWGNQHEIKGGLTFQYGGISITPKFLARVPLSHPLSYNEGGPRKTLFDPFAVYDNREAYKAELILTWDPAGDTYFFDWDNSDRENAVLAAYLSFLYSFYEGPTDARSYKDRYGNSISFGLGLPEVRGLWSLKSRVVWNAAPALRVVGGLQGGADQSRGEDTRIVNFWGGFLTLRLGDWIIDSSVDINTWGQEDWYKEFNITYPLQWKLDVSWGFEMPSFLNLENRIGLRWKGRTYDEYAPEDETADGLYQWRMELLLYGSISW